MRDDPAISAAAGTGAALAPAVGCPDCSAGRDHCHGVLVVHGDASSECVDSPGCDPAMERHPLVETCTRLQPPCRCSDPDVSPMPG